MIAEEQRGKFLCSRRFYRLRSLVADVTRSLRPTDLLQRQRCGYSAGSQPKSQLHPLAPAVLAAHGRDASHLRSKSWLAFTEPGVPVVDLVITVCDEAAGEACPYFPGGPVTVHWGMHDPAASHTQTTEERLAFERAYDLLVRRLRRLVALPDEALQGPTTADRLAEIAELQSAGPA